MANAGLYDRTVLTTNDQNNGEVSDITKIENIQGYTADQMDANWGDYNTHKTAATLDHPDGSVTTAKLADLSVTNGKIAAATITQDKLVTGTLDNRYYTETEIDNKLSAAVGGQSYSFRAVSTLPNDPLNGDVVVLTADQTLNGVTYKANNAYQYLNGRWTQFAQQAPLETTRKFLKSKYVMATFSNAADNKLVFMTSDDALNFKVVDANGSYVAASGKVRDPSIIKYQDWYYITHSKGDWTVSTNSLGLLRTKDFVNFETLADIPTGFDKSWSPEWYYDSNGALVIIFTASTVGSTNFKPYYISVNNDITTFGTPVEITGTGLATNMIDLHGVLLNGHNFMWYKNETTKYIEIFSDVTGSYTPFRTGDWAGWGSGLEGAFLVKMEDRWRIYLDAYGTLQMYYSDSFDNWATWTPKHLINTDFACRHLTILENHGDMFAYPEPMINKNKSPVFCSGEVGAPKSYVEVRKSTEATDPNTIKLVTADTGSATSFESVRIAHDRTSESKGIVTNMEFYKDNVMRVYAITGNAPASNVGSGGFLYVEAGALKFRGGNGTVTVLGPA